MNEKFKIKKKARDEFIHNRAFNLNDSRQLIADSFFDEEGRKAEGIITNVLLILHQVN